MSDILKFIGHTYRKGIMLESKGYIGEVVCDDGAEVLHERVINSGLFPIANAEATNVEGIERESRLWIDVYLAGCAKLGITPFASSGISRGN